MFLLKEMVLKLPFILLTTFSLFSAPLLAIDLEPGPVAITKGVMKVPVKSASGDIVIIQRNQDNDAVIEGEYAKTSRPCPPACIQPNSLGYGVETIAELELIEYIKKSGTKKNNVLIIDSRVPSQFEQGIIPGAVNIPWTTLDQGQGAETADIMKIMTNTMGVKIKKGVDGFAVDEAIANGNAGQLFDFSKAKTLVFYCNGSYCGQSPKNISQLMRMGYPADKIKWYRGGLDDWMGLGFTVIQP